MRIKHIFAILLLVSLGLVAVLFIRAVPQNSAAATAPQLLPPPREEILVAARPLSAGLLLRAQDVTWRGRSGAALSGDIVRPSPEERAAKPESDEVDGAAVYGANLQEDTTKRGAPRIGTTSTPRRQES